MPSGFVPDSRQEGSGAVRSMGQGMANGGNLLMSSPVLPGVEQQQQQVQQQQQQMHMGQGMTNHFGSSSNSALMSNGAPVLIRNRDYGVGNQGMMGVSIRFSCFCT